MEPEPNSDNEEKKDPNSTEAMKEKAKGKRPMEEEVALSSSDSDLEQITKKAGGIVINELRSTTVINTSANASKGKALTDSKRSKGKTENVVKSSYSLRSRDKGVMDIDAKPTKGKRGKKRKGKELKRFVVESKERLKRRRDRDDDEKDDKGGTGAYATRSSTKKTKERSL